MSEIQETLGPDEKIEFRVRTSRFVYPFFYVAAFVVFLFFLLTRVWFSWAIILVILGYVEIVISQKSYYFTNQRIIQEIGMFSKNWVHVPYNKITDITVNKSAIERILDIGTIDIDTSGTEKFEEKIELVHDPERIERFIQNKISDIRVR